MPATPRRAGRTAPTGALHPSEVLAQNLRGYRALRGFSQAGLAERMSELGQPWHRGTPSEVERGSRPVSVDELVTLALALGVTVAALLDPAGPDGSGTAGLYVGGVHDAKGRKYLSHGMARVLAHSAARVTVEGKAASVPLNPETLPYLGKPVGGGAS